MKIKLSELKEKTGIGFGSSGIRGLVTSLTDEVVYAYTLAFIKHLKNIGDGDKKIAVAGDLRDSTDRIMSVVAKAIYDSGLEVVNCGKIPTPAVTFFGIKNKMPSIMITGSHIPADRNGIKFNKSDGEVLKADEAAITKMEVEYDTTDFRASLPTITTEAETIYINRYRKMFDANCLDGLRIGVYQHSAVGREIIINVLNSLGAKTTPLDTSDYFIPVDTEVISEELKAKGKDLIIRSEFDALISTDGDGDRPLLSDENGEWLRADILGIKAAKFLKSEIVVVPISCNTAVDKCGYFEKVEKTKIGSPYIVAKMMEYFGKKKVVGYEANGGFFTEELPTRDALIPLLCWLVLAKKENKKISELRDELPKRFTWSGSIKGFPTETALRIVGENKEKTLMEIEEYFGKIKEVDEIDGLRVTLENDDIIHLRPSLNSPEFRNYTEASSDEKVNELSNKANNLIASWQG